MSIDQGRVAQLAPGHECRPTVLVVDEDPGPQTTNLRSQQELTSVDRGNGGRRGATSLT
jgi:hypothetical protein